MRTSLIFLAAAVLPATSPATAQPATTNETARVAEELQALRGDWRYVASDAQTAVYIDASSVSREADRVRYRENVIFIQPLSNGVDQRISLISADCPNSSFETTERSFYRDANLVSSGPGTPGRRQVGPRTLAGASIRAACYGTRSETVTDPRRHAQSIQASTDR